MSKALILATVTLVLITSPGCFSLLPSAKQSTRSQWNTFDEVKSAFDQIKSGQTKTHELSQLGFDPMVEPNIELLTYLDIMECFMANPSIEITDLDPKLQDCIAQKKLCSGYKFSLTRTKEERFGNFFLDLFDFKRKTKKTGWEFNALIVFKDGLVVYKLWWGKPKISEITEKRKPLGPLQNCGDLLMDVTRSGVQ